MTISAVQKQERQFYIGASDAAAVVGLDPYRTAVDVFLAKGDNAQASDFDDNNLNIVLGNALEPVIGKLAGDEIGEKVFRKNTTLIHPEWDFIAANLDYTVGRALPLVPIECKLTNNFLALKEPLPQHVPQILQQMACTGADHGFLAYIIDGRGRQFRLYRIDRDEEAINGLITILCDFWFGHVLTGIAPEVTRVNDLDLLYGRAKKSEAIIVGAEVFEAARQLINVKDQLKTLGQQETDLSLTVKAALGDHEYAKYGDVDLASWKNNADKTFFDLDLALANIAGLAPHPDDKPKDKKRKAEQLALLKQRGEDLLLADMIGVNDLTDEEITARIDEIRQAYVTTKQGPRVLRLNAKAFATPEEKSNEQQ